jgi:hypothetical protein
VIAYPVGLRSTGDQATVPGKVQFRQALRGVAAHLRPTKGRIAKLGFFLVVLLALSALAPEPAHANWVSDAAANAVKKIFGVKGDWLSGTFVQWLIQIKSPGLTSDGAGAALYIATRDFAFAALGAVLTLSVIHYWASGIFSQGGGAGIAIEGLIRTIGAALFVLAWPFIIDTGVDLSAIIRDELIPGAKLDAINAALAAASIFSPGLLVGIIVVSAYSLIALALYVTKVMLTVALLTLASMMPLAMVLWAIPGLSWFANAMLKACAAIVAVQVAWAGEVYLYAWIPSDWITFSGNGHVLSKLGAPITMIALLFLMLMTASWVLRLAGMGAGNFVSFLSSQLAVGAINEKAGKAKSAFRDLQERGSSQGARAARLEGQGILRLGNFLARHPEKHAGTAKNAPDPGGKSSGQPNSDRDGKSKLRKVSRRPPGARREGSLGGDSAGGPGAPGKQGKPGAAKPDRGAPAKGQAPPTSQPPGRSAGSGGERSGTQPTTPPPGQAAPRSRPGTSSAPPGEPGPPPDPHGQPPPTNGSNE